MAHLHQGNDIIQNVIRQIKTQTVTVIKQCQLPILSRVILLNVFCLSVILFSVTLLNVTMTDNQFWTIFHNHFLYLLS